MHAFWAVTLARNERYSPMVVVSTYPFDSNRSEVKNTFPRRVTSTEYPESSFGTFFNSHWNVQIIFLDEVETRL
jgi:hypothetical protein